MNWLFIYLILASITICTISEAAQPIKLENSEIKVLIDASAGKFSVTDKKSGYIWKQPTQSATAPYTDGVIANNNARFSTNLIDKTNNVVPVTLDFNLLKENGLSIGMDIKDKSAKFNETAFLPPLVLDTPDAFMASTDSSNGHIYKLDWDNFPAWGTDGDSMDIPFIGLCDIKTGIGNIMILDTPDDLRINFPKYKINGKNLSLPLITWKPSMGSFAYKRKIIYKFVSSGSYVALAKEYRQYAKEKGILVTFAQKIKKNPNLKRLFGAMDVWGFGGNMLEFAKTAKSLGIDKMILNLDVPGSEMSEINKLGYLTSCYDNYTDVRALKSGDEVDTTHDIIPDHLVSQADGERMSAWTEADGSKFMKRCPSFWVPTAKITIPKHIKDKPYIGRFIDVTTSEGLYECYDPNHPLSRTQKRSCGEDLLGYVRSLGLVVGGEHGRWWGVPHLDYLEGMMSGGFDAWPAGWLTKPKTRSQEFTYPWGEKVPGWDGYDKYGIGHEYRIPLWELVFHDCVVTTWYWGDSSEWLSDAAPEYTAKKNAFNILYATIPMIWIDERGIWNSNREEDLTIYRNTCKLHEVIGGKEMLSHQFVTSDNAVQQTKFSDGTIVTVNFGSKPYLFKHDKNEYLLPQNGFYVKGPKIEQSMVMVKDKIVTTIKTKNFYFCDAPK